MIPGDMVKITDIPWNHHAGDLVIVTKVDEDGKGFDFVIPEQRGHAPMRFAVATLGHFDLEKLGVKVAKVILIFVWLAFAASAHAQSTLDWTLANDPGFACASCATVIGSGMFTASPTQFASIQGNGYPILSLTGTLNGAAVTLGKGPSGGLGNLYFAPSLPVAWFAPLYLTTAAGTFTLSQSDAPQPGTGQLLVGPSGSAASPVAFTVAPYVAPTPVPIAPTPKAPPTPTYSSNAGSALAARGIGMGHVVFQRPVVATAIAPRRNPVVIEVSVISAAALIVGVVEWERQRRHYDAVPAGRY